MTPRPTLHHLLSEALTLQPQPERAIIAYVQQYRDASHVDVLAALRQRRREGRAKASEPHADGVRFWECVVVKKVAA